MRAGDRDRYLATLYAPAPVRPALFALWALDLELGAVVTGASDAMIAEIKLAWWREALERLDHAPPPAQPVLQALAAEVLPRGVTGAALARLEDGWLANLGGEAAPVLSAGSLLHQLAETLVGEGGVRPLDGLRLLAARDTARAQAGKCMEPRGSLPRQLILLRAVALGR